MCHPCADRTDGPIEELQKRKLITLTVSAKRSKALVKTSISVNLLRTGTARYVDSNALGLIDEENPLELSVNAYKEHEQPLFFETKLGGKVHSYSVLCQLSKSKEPLE